MLEFGVKVVYSLVLSGVAALCLREVWQVWCDNTLQYGQFVATKDGQDVPGQADTFRRLILQQQGLLYRLYSPSQAKPGEFRVGANPLTIRLSDLGQLPSSGLEDVKIEAGGINVTSLLAKLRRQIKTPNEITGSVDQIGTQIYISADWKSAPRRNGKGTEPHTFALPPQTDLNLASFDLACRIFLIRVAPTQPMLRSADEDQFCLFSTAFDTFHRYLALRDRAMTDSGRSNAGGLLSRAEQQIEALVTAKTSLPYAYKLAAYITIERATTQSSDAKLISNSLDHAQDLLLQYASHLVAIEPNASDKDVEDRLAYLAARRGAVPSVAAAKQPDLAAMAALLRSVDTVRTVAESSKGATEPTRPGPPAESAPLAPGASIGPMNVPIAVSLCCTVTGSDGQRYLVTAGHSLGTSHEQVEIISPAYIDDSSIKQVVARTSLSAGDVAFLQLGDNIKVTNDPIKGIAEVPALGADVTILGRTSLRVEGHVVATHVKMPSFWGSSDEVMLVDAPTRPGDSGAPVLDSEHRLLGIVLGGMLDGAVEKTVVLPVGSVFRAHGLTLL